MKPCVSRERVGGVGEARVAGAGQLQLLDWLSLKLMKYQCPRRFVGNMINSQINDHFVGN